MDIMNNNKHIYMIHHGGGFKSLVGHSNAKSELKDFTAERLHKFEIFCTSRVLNSHIRILDILAMPWSRLRKGELKKCWSSAFPDFDFIWVAAYEQNRFSFRFCTENLFQTLSIYIITYYLVISFPYCLKNIVGLSSKELM